jgi:hypothetical protein
MAQRGHAQYLKTYANIVHHTYIVEFEDGEELLFPHGAIEKQITSDSPKFRLYEGHLKTIIAQLNDKASVFNPMLT